MSAWMVDKVHIDLMVAVARRGLKTGETRWEFRAYDWQGQQRMIDDADALGLMLARENVRSLVARYGEEAGGRYYPDGPETDGMVHWDVEGYRFADPGIDLTVVEVLKALHCYSYQSCESDDWDRAQAFAFCAALEKAIIYGSRWQLTPSDKHWTIPGWDDAPWGWSDKDVAARLIFQGKLDQVWVVPGR